MKKYWLYLKWLYKGLVHLPYSEVDINTAKNTDGMHFVTILANMPEAGINEFIFSDFCDEVSNLF